MALDQVAQYPIGTSAPTADYPEGSAVNSTAVGALNGYPWEKEQINDRFGLEQALLRLSGQAASGNPDTALISQYLKGIIELAAGRATNYNETGIADAYILSLQTNQQGPAGVFDGLRMRFTPSNTNTGASTINLTAIGGGAAVAIENNDGNALPAGYLTLEAWEATYMGGVVYLDRPVGGEYFKVTDTKGSGTQGGSTVTATNNIRVLNTIDRDTGGNVSLAANQITLQAGVYTGVKAWAGVLAANSHKLRLYNVTGTSYDIEGFSKYTDTVDNVVSESVLSDMLILAIDTTFELRHYTAIGKVTTGLGIASSTGSEIYAQIEGRKIA